MPTGRAKNYFENALSELKKLTPKNREEDIILKNISWYIAALKVECDELEELLPDGFNNNPYLDVPKD